MSKFTNSQTYIMKTKLLFFVLLVALVSSCSKTKEVKSGNIIVDVPVIYDVETSAFNQLSDFMSGIVAANKKMNHVYFFFEMKMKCTPEYLMEYSVKNALANMSTSSHWGEVEKTQFQSYDAIKSNFTTTFEGQIMNGIAYAFNDGKSRSYGVIALHKDKIPAEDPVLKTFRLAPNTDPVVTYKNAGEEMQHFVEQIRPIFGHDTGNGFTINDIVVYPEKKELVYTMAVTNTSKSDLDISELKAAQAEIKANMSEAVKEMAGNQPPLHSCMKEGYTITFNIVDMNNEQLFDTTLSPEDYQ